MGLWRRAATGKKWRGEPTLDLRLKDPKNPGKYLSFHTVKITPLVEDAVPVVHLWYQAGGMAGAGPLTVDDARAVAYALLAAIEQSRSAVTELDAETEPAAGNGTSASPASRPGDGCG